MPNIPPKLNARSFCLFVFFFTSRGNSIWNSGHFKLNMIMDYVTFIREHRIHIQINNSHISSRLRVVPHFSSRIVERAERERAWKSPHARKGDTQRGERKMRDYRQSPSFWTNALLSQRKTPIGSSMEICQHLSITRQPLSTLDIITIYRTNNWSRTNNSREQITSKSCSCRSN